MIAEKDSAGWVLSFLFQGDPSGLPLIFYFIRYGRKDESSVFCRQRAFLEESYAVPKMIRKFSKV